MANYYESSRSNYFKVKDVEALQRVAKLYGARVEKKDEAHPDLFCLLWSDGFREIPYDFEANEEVDGDFTSDIAELLQDDYVCVVMGAGAEKLRYINGWAFAVDSTGEVAIINLDEIYTRAKATFPDKIITTATY